MWRSDVFGWCFSKVRGAWACLAGRWLEAELGQRLVHGSIAPPPPPTRARVSGLSYRARSSNLRALTTERTLHYVGLYSDILARAAADPAVLVAYCCRQL
jgi:hypothetical protein